MNFAHLMPFQSIAPILIKNEEFPEFPFFSGTGFFVKFNPYNSIYFITAKHCTLNHDNSPKGIVGVPLQQNSECNKKIIFSHYLLAKTNNDADFDDIIIYVVDISFENQFDLLKDRCLRLLHQEDVDNILDYVLSIKGKLRAVGCPGTEEKQINYDTRQSTIQPRGIVGCLSSASDDKLNYTIDNINWKSSNGGMDGFSGSPIIEFIPNINRTGIESIPVGVFSTGNAKIIKFVSIKVVTDAIAEYINLASTSTNGDTP
ncbi:hypothetical protein [Amphibiibacter pelophylacis]|uniref:Uncharacterized protein n=1 Tax=Amphibiibacter pelophylacis TaxID=1799477 RepID=A0ACC6NZN7_9BURK